MINNNSSNSDFKVVEEHVNRMVQGIRTFLDPQHGKITAEEEEEGAGAAGTAKVKKVITVNPATRKYAELRIKILQDSPRDATKLRGILQVNQKEYRKAQDSEEIERLITEIDVLEYLLFLVNREERQRETHIAAERIR